MAGIGGGDVLARAAALPCVPLQPEARADRLAVPVHSGGRSSGMPVEVCHRLLEGMGVRLPELAALRLPCRKHPVLPEPRWQSAHVLACSPVLLEAAVADPGAAAEGTRDALSMVRVRIDPDLVCHGDAHVPMRVDGSRCTPWPCGCRTVMASPGRHMDVAGYVLYLDDPEGKLLLPPSCAICLKRSSTPSTSTPLLYLGQKTTWCLQL